METRHQSSLVTIHLSWSNLIETVKGQIKNLYAPFCFTYRHKELFTRYLCIFINYAGLISRVFNNMTNYYNKRPSSCNVSRFQDTIDLLSIVKRHLFSNKENDVVCVTKPHWTHNTPNSRHRTGLGHNFLDSRFKECDMMSI